MYIVFIKYNTTEDFSQKYESSKIDDARDPSEDSSCEQEHLKTDR